MTQGWIGNWSPGIGDPTLGGWITVALYAWAAWRCYRVQSHKRMRSPGSDQHEQVVWRAMLFVLIALGINKQLDLQTAFTELGRFLAHRQGWYDNRRQYQEAFIAAVPVIALTLLAVMTFFVWRAPAPTLWACAGATGLLVFVVIRAISFHHVDDMLGWHLAGFNLNWALEMGSLLVVGFAARKRVRMRR